MKLNEVYEIANTIAPKKLSDEACSVYGWYDNSGVLVDVGEEIKGILFSLDLSFSAIEECIEKDCNLILTHHPAMYGKLNHARFDGEDLVEQKLVKVLRNGISVISMHLNVDYADEGTDAYLAEGICASSEIGAKCEPIAYMQSVEGGKYGRVYDVKPCTLRRLTVGIKSTFASQRVLAYGKEDREIRRVASFCGAGADEKSVLFAKENGADVIISSDFKHHVLTYALELGLSVIALTHYASENYGFKKYYEKISQSVSVPCVFHTDEERL